MECRKLLPPEEKLLEFLIKKANLSGWSINWKCNLLVKPMNDGGMGSLLLFPDGSEGKNRVFGKQVSEYEFNDKDGVKVIASLNLDSSGELFELDIWKVDYSKLICIPENL
jgi:hypothetical protein